MTGMNDRKAGRIVKDVTVQAAETENGGIRRAFNVKDRIEG